MHICRVIGTVVSSVKRDELKGFKLLVVEDVSPNGEPSGRSFVAIDSVGAGEKELVLVTVGSAAARVRPAVPLPVDAAVVGIIDSVAADGKVTYSKQGSV